MSTYREIHGKAVKSLDTDPSATTDAGQIWYNTSSDTFKSIVQSEAWSSQSLTSSQHGDGAGCGDVPAVVIWGGYSPDAPPVTASTEEWNGTGWTTGGNYPFAGFGGVGSAGTQTAALGIAGRLAPPAGTSSDVTGEYDGSSWTTGGAFPEINYGAGGFGTQTAGVAYGGNNRADAAPSNPSPSSGTMQYTKEYDGSSWTAGNNYPVAVSQGTATGSLTAGIGAGGSNRPDGSAVANSATYDGTNWTAITNIPGVKAALGMTGTQTASIIFGGNPGPTGNQSVKWDGTSWAAAPNLAGPGYGGGSGHNSTPTGSTSALIGARRDGSNYPYATEEFNTSITVTTPAVFSSGNNQNLSTYNRSGWGTQNAAWLAGGGFPSDKNESEEFDGTSWTEGDNLNTARNSGAVGGPQTAAIFSTGSRLTNMEYYNGSSWSNQTACPTARSSAAGGGTQTSFVQAGGGSVGPPTYAINNTGEEWNGSSWTSSGTLPAAQGSMNGAAIGESESAAMLAGGVISPAGPPGVVPHSVTNISLDYGGTSWTANPNINTARESGYLFGTTSSAILAGGYDTAKTTISEQWNGSVFVTGVNMTTARYTGGRAGATSTAGLVAGGYPGGDPSANATELYTGETTSISAKTLTTG